MVKENRNVIEAITLFAYMFCIFLLLILLLRGAQLLIKARMRPKVIQEMVNLNIRTRVHAIIIFIVVFSFVILGISTIKFFTNRYDQQHRKKLDNEINSVLVNVENVFSKNFSSDVVMHFYYLSFQTHIKNAIQDIADMYGVDINIYDLDGNLGISTQSLIYKNGLLSHKMDPKAYYKLHTLHQIQVIQKEQIGSLNFLSSYVPVRNTEGQVMAFLNQPYYASQTDLKQEISNFLVTLINLNAFIFLLSGLLALLFTNSITRSFTLISEKLRHVNLSGKNEEIVWKHHDEIGKLVKEYNIMVHKLEESAAMLAKSEREGAWREMARQVAHEIKNPLTPMKLSLQHLQRAIRDDSPKKQKLTEDVSKTLIEQIEHLSQIASDFSAFANIAYASKEKILLNNILSSVTTLHKGYEKVKVQYQKPQEPYYIYADKTQMNRLFTNLVQNAMQAISDGQKGMVTVSTEREDDHVIVKVKDDGTGIPDELKDKIFTPNFTTKSSGTGLGLAICKNIVQQAEGDIWFDTRKDKGTVFYVKLPLMEQ
jgi:signal transduction histidine kinase